MALTVPAAMAQEGQLDASPGLFTVMAAINAVGYAADLSSPNNHPLRDAIRAELAKRNIPSLPAIKAFFDQHRKNKDTDELSQYISFALTAGGPPDFAIQLRNVDIPPDAAPLQGLSPLLAAFYKEANIEDLWKRSQPAIDQYIERYHGPVSDAVLQVNAYLRQQTSGARGRRFQIYIELLAAPNQIQTRSYGYEYTIVITPSPELRTFDVRHAYLHYLLDPLSTRYQEILERKKGLVDHAQRAHALADSFKDDFLLLVTESLIKAVEARLDHKPEGVQAALREGYILAPYFAERLPVYEKQEQSMAFYYSDMVSAIDVVKEDKRLSLVEFNTEETVRTVKTAPPPGPVGTPPPAYRRRQDAGGSGTDLHGPGPGHGEETVPRGFAANGQPAHARGGILWSRADRSASARPRNGGKAVREDPGIATRGAGEGLGTGLPGEAFHGRGRPRTGGQTFPRRSEGGWRIAPRAPRRGTGRATTLKAGRKTRSSQMKRMILTGALALVAGVSSLMAQAAPPKAPAPKSKDELAAVQALFTATRTGPDATIKAAEDLLTKFADTDFKDVALLSEAEA